jgi:integrase
VVCITNCYFQVRRSVVGTPKGRTRRTIPMTDRLHDALAAIDPRRRREGLVFCKEDGAALSDGQGQRGLDRVCRVAELPERPWHILRHSFATHAAMFGVNPWSLMTWLGHKRMEETMRYVHVAQAHRRPLPEPILEAAREPDPDRRVLGMLSARGNLTATETAPTVKPQYLSIVK